MISIIVPALNEENIIATLLEQLAALPGEKELIVVDGGSSDETIALSSPFAHVLSSERGRGMQCNAGARRASGNILLFLHADSSLEADALQAIEQAVAQGAQWGSLKLRFDQPSLPALLTAHASNLRARWSKIVYGDQGIFIQRSLFDEIQGFPSLPLMEDYQLSRMLRKRRLAPTLVNSIITTSSRRFLEDGWLATLWQMYKLRRKFRQGSSVSDIQAHYHNVRSKASA